MVRETGKSQTHNPHTCKCYLCQATHRAAAQGGCTSPMNPASSKDEKLAGCDQHISSRTGISRTPGHEFTSSLQSSPALTEPTCIFRDKSFFSLPCHISKQLVCCDEGRPVGSDTPLRQPRHLSRLVKPQRPALAPCWNSQAIVLRSCRLKGMPLPHVYCQQYQGAG